MSLTVDNGRRVRPVALPRAELDSRFDVPTLRGQFLVLAQEMEPPAPFRALDCVWRDVRRHAYSRPHGPWASDLTIDGLSLVPDPDPVVTGHALTHTAGMVITVCPLGTGAAIMGRCVHPLFADYFGLFVAHITRTGVATDTARRARRLLRTLRELP